MGERGSPLSLGVELWFAFRNDTYSQPSSSRAWQAKNKEVTWLAIEMGNKVVDGKTSSVVPRKTAISFRSGAKSPQVISHHHSLKE